MLLPIFINTKQSAVTNTVTYTSDNTEPVDICFGKLSLEIKKIKQIKNA